MADDGLLTDLRLTRPMFDQEVADRDAADLVASASGDLELVGGQANLAQAIVNRLLTRKGELTALGHPDYGSRLHLLIGEVNNARTRKLAEIYVRESLADEPRVHAVTGVAFRSAARADGRDALMVSVLLKGGGELTLAVPMQGGG